MTETIGGEARFSYVPPTAVSDATAAGVSAHEPARSHTAGEIHGVVRVCQEKLQRVQENMAVCENPAVGFCKSKQSESRELCLNF